MVRVGGRLPGFCLSQIATRVRMRSPPLESKPAQPTGPSGNEGKDSKDSSEKRSEVVGYVGRRVMVVLDSSAEAKCALQWALSQSVQSSDTLVLLDVVKPSKQGDQTEKERDAKDFQLLNAMRSVCQAKRPEVQVELTLVEGKDRGPTIVEEARKQNISLLVLGQKRRSITWRLLMMWAGNRMDGGAVDYCVQNATCMALAVRRKSRRGGGYLITTKRHKDFWLLA
ncbi:uncharacterized protein A4U43_C10F9990 [Asparagus officinalis]|uniref:UspA domain-containing protein n=1 Tax=Asparagus officinalis TaxID=4686 RepID=A0A5P1E3K3_ASPOF|nr:uncharacterized protein LOC109826097 [Asparagus officinalis]ONK56553.1 uncharacterized protein A4U43_C10F9990 [Asparagus officinalis]